MENSMEYAPLKRHIYPLWIIVSVGIVIVSAILLGYKHVHNESYYKNLRIIKREADASFIGRDYDNAIKSYKILLDKYPSYKIARMRIVESYFALSIYDEELFYVGYKYLENIKFDKREIKELASYLPEEYREFFLMQFRK